MFSNIFNSKRKSGLPPFRHAQSGPAGDTGNGAVDWSNRDLQSSLSADATILRDDQSRCTSDSAFSASSRELSLGMELRQTAAQLWNGVASAPEVAHTPELPSATEPLAGHSHYVPLQMLNNGASGFVQLAADRRTGQRYAVKFIKRGEAFDVKTISRELMNQRMCYGHPNIIQLQEVFLTSHHLGVAMEYADGGDLSQYIDDQSQKGIDGLPEEDVRWLFQQLVVALDYCHRLGIANRDVKLDNMMLHGTWPSPVLKICDFGFSKYEAGQSISKSTCGTPEYMAPEVLFEQHYDGRAADIWSCGVSLYVMLTGVFPFARADDEEVTNVVRMQRMFTRIIQGDYAPLQRVSAECEDLMHMLLQPDPAKRINMAGIMNHAWFLRNLPPPLLSLNLRIMATSAHNAGISGGTQTATEVLTLVAGGKSMRVMRSASASPADYSQGVSDLQLNPPLERANSQPDTLPSPQQLLRQQQRCHPPPVPAFARQPSPLHYGSAPLPYEASYLQESPPLDGYAYQQQLQQQQQAAYQQQLYQQQQQQLAEHAATLSLGRTPQMHVEHQHPAAEVAMEIVQHDMAPDGLPATRFQRMSL